METQNITPKQSVEIFSQIAFQFRGTRQEHELIEKAIKCLAQLAEAESPQEKQ